MSMFDIYLFFNQCERNLIFKILNRFSLKNNNKTNYMLLVFDIVIKKSLHINNKIFIKCSNTLTITLLYISVSLENDSC